jgi:Recombinase
VDDPTLNVSCNPPITIMLPWTAPSFATVNGIIHEPGVKLTMKPESRDALLAAIAKARGWIHDIQLGRIASFAEIAERRQLANGIRAYCTTRLSVTPHRCGDRPWHGACGSHSHRPRQGLALFLGRAGAEDRAPFAVAAIFVAAGFGVEALAHLLKNRFYIGEVNYRGEVCRGEHEPILARNLFEAVQAKRAANAVARQVRLRGSATPWSATSSTTAATT